MDSPFSEGDLWSGLRSCHKHGRGPSLLYPHAVKPSNKKANCFEETNKVKRRLKIVKPQVKDLKPRISPLNKLTD